MNKASVQTGLTVPSNSILVDCVVFYFILVYLCIYYFILLVYGAVSVADYVVSYGWMYGE
jgi:hypothetical protein